MIGARPSTVRTFNRRSIGLGWLGFPSMGSWRGAITWYGAGASRACRFRLVSARPSSKARLMAAHVFASGSLGSPGSPGTVWICQDVWCIPRHSPKVPCGGVVRERLRQTKPVSFGEGKRSSRSSPLKPTEDAIFPGIDTDKFDIWQDAVKKSYSSVHNLPVDYCSAYLDAQNL